VNVASEYCKGPESCVGVQCKVLEFSVWWPCLPSTSGSTCVVDGPNTWEATDGHGPGDVRVGWRMRIEGLVA